MLCNDALLAFSFLHVNRIFVCTRKKMTAKREREKSFHFHYCETALHARYTIHIQLDQISTFLVVSLLCHGEMKRNDDEQ